MGVTSYFQIQSLFDLCIRKICHEYFSLLNDLDFLPLRAKERILDILCKRGKANKKCLQDLANHQIKKLDLYGNDVTDDVLKCAEVCINLRSLTVATSRNQPIYITDIGLLDTLPHFKLLRVVQINNCIHITDRSIIVLAESCPKLEVVNIGGCSLVGDNSLISLVINCPLIRALTISRTKVTDKGIYSLTQSPCQQNLKELQLDGCDLISDMSIEFLGQYCTRLTILTFSNCRNITDQSRYIMANFMERNGSQMKQMFWSISV